MDKFKIGENAGIIWRMMDNNKHWEYGELKKATKGKGAGQCSFDDRAYIRLRVESLSDLSESPIIR